MRWASLLSALFLLSIAGSAGAVVTPIGDLHFNFANGIPLHNGQLVTVQGTVTVPHGTFGNFNLDVHIQDGTGGIDVFVPAGVGTYNFVLGDSVEVTGYVKHFNGLCEIDSSSAFVTVTQLGPAAVPPEPLVMTCQQVANSYQAGDHEPNESRLIRINGVTITGGAWPTTPSGGNTILTIQDGTGTSTIFIDTDTAVDGSPHPGTLFDIIGVLRQFDSSNPYTTGYQIVPRFLTDVIPQCAGPGYTTDPVVNPVDSLSATITWGTDSPGTSFVRYGTTPTYTDSVGTATPTTSHTVVLTGLQPRTLYHFQAKSSDGNGTCYSVQRTFVTLPSPGTAGGIQVYFNKSVDHSVAQGPLAAGNIDMLVPLEALIDSAKVSIDVAMYSFNLPEVADMLIAAKQRGVQVRLITDANNSTVQADRMAAEGIPYITSTFGGLNHGQAAGFGIMHDKYFVVDAKSANKDHAYVWTGSWNATDLGQAEANNTIVLHDYGLAAAYTVDFEQMWGSSTATASAALSKMGSRKSDVIPHQFRVGGIRVEAYMSPSDQPEARMIQYIQQAQHSQLFCIFDFTSDPLSLAMRAHRDSSVNFSVRGLFEGGQVGPFSEWCRLNGDMSCANFWSPRADVFQNFETEFTLLHHKYQILDNWYPEAAVWTGSHNWSNAAKTVNDENTLVVHDPTIANLYFQEWYRRYVQSGGSALAVLPPGRSGNLELSACRPNPARGTAAFEYSLRNPAARVRLGIYDLAGRHVRALVDGPVGAGIHRARWDGRNDSGAAQGAGIYFYRLEAGTEFVARRLVLLP
jgi:phosphatidylserine/phosphatidylglycerophosphate/cardiolipin synthase-like enzyme